MRRVYLAGFDVFAPDAHERGQQMKRLCAQYDLEGVYPLDNQAQSAEEIYQGNLTLIRQADLVAANVNPFRGCEPDSGTAFEIGYAAALGKPIWCYLSDARTLRDKLGETDENGFSVEDFGSPLNLMLSQSARVVEGDFIACLHAIMEDT